MGKICLILGGARSGKSRFAIDLAQKRAQKVVYLATGLSRVVSFTKVTENRKGTPAFVTSGLSVDEEMAARIEKHRQSRPRNWRTVEASDDVTKKVAGLDPDTGLVIVDCLTFFISNLLGRWNFTEEGSQIKESLIEDTVMEEMELLLEEIKASPADFIVVSNEVGMGLVPPYPLGRIFRDLMGRAHQLLAEAADEAYLLVAGLPQKLK
ncbi:bifunctional adenosylcobinamide kinase/adenosylcobinamide-phosphate guanylyltransferase [Candidatus Hakubella thermalkaliphila]|uniref:Adenosylcobinamide kinase n=1 Tax=Candidatus Hakubella thermalkaliphila TaxID=2754717 RepID=A0A6V8P6B6_9ACTN|nr:bifunctional adenosylcobinamide kinase/adenosylcobinamide-phosphate guanylyltransferase [Candidatus Hakubella thermalkaliphila]GFP27500.1 adenosylcobinamide kinase / adenosylcobinamide-phosphate guanylyltransferase [Candidatus Hakubella thermalkaliphila]